MAPSVLAPENHHDARSRRRIKSAGGDSTPELGEGLENVLGPPNCEKSSGGRSLPVKFASAFDLVDEECHNHPSRSEAQVLLSALEQFIRSTIHAQPMQNRPQQSDNKLDAGTLNKNGPLAGGSPNSTASSDNLPSPIDKERHARSSSRSEAQVLLSALEAFIQSNIRGPFAREGAPESDNKPVSANPECLLNNKEFLASGSSGRAPLVGCSLDKEQSSTVDYGPVQWLPPRLMDGLRERVFNQMPIRLLTVGSEMQLLDRNDVLQHIFHQMPHIDERAFEEMVILKLNNTVTGLKSQEEAEEMVIEDLFRKYARYAILSHTWLQGAPEATFSEWSSISHRGGAGYEKLAEFCQAAAKESGITLARQHLIRM